MLGLNWSFVSRAMSLCQYVLGLLLLPKLSTLKKSVGLLGCHEFLPRPALAWSFVADSAAVRL